MKKISGTPLLKVRNLFASVEGKEVLKGISLDVEAGAVHVIMGPNGSGKSTLAYALMGHPHYEVKSHLSKVKSSIEIGNTDVLNLPTEERARAGLYLAIQSPIAIPGVSVMQLLRTAYQLLHIEQSQKINETPNIQNPVLVRRWQANGMGLTEFVRRVKQFAGQLRLDESFLSRSVHDGFSGGEKKKVEMLQALVLAPKIAIFDEIDTGLDVDALRVVGKGIDVLRRQKTGVIIITHYNRILRYVTPDVVHVLVGGKIVDTGAAALAGKIEKEGYAKYL
ncbi:MAG: Fe-S cluster assembly ATPase SufC [Candidatus Gottesmanbacteria bacterium]|nr:Fe-S cluster assembly ATPase SufC [Candidatus Gottesmanbacteria bacterium]